MIVQSSSSCNLIQLYCCIVIKLYRQMKRVGVENQQIGVVSGRLCVEN